MKNRSGRKSSDLDNIRPEIWEFTEDLLHVIWILEKTIALYPELAENLHNIINGDVFTEDELPKPTEEERKAPKIEKPKPIQLTIESAYNNNRNNNP